MVYHTLYKDSSDTSKGLSPNIWATCPSEGELRVGPRQGFGVYDGFERFIEVAAAAEATYGLYRGFGSTGATVVDGGEQGGTIVFTNAATDNTGCSLRTWQNPFQISSGLGDLWFECRIKSSTIADTKHGIFVGLIEEVTLSATVPIAAAGTLSDNNFVGFHRLEADGDQMDTVYKADGVTQVTVKADALPAALVADTYVKLGMRFDSSDDKLRFYVDGKELADNKAIPDATGTDFPADVRLGLVMAVLTATGTAPGDSEMDWWACVQLY